MLMLSNEGILLLTIEDHEDFGDITIKGYLKELLKALWREGEGFSGKRPFGNSGWEADLAKPLIKAGIITGSIDEDGYIEDYDGRELERIIAGVIESL